MALAVENPPASSGDVTDLDSIPRSGRPPGGGHGNPHQYSCLKNPMDRGACQTTVHGVTKSQTRLKHSSICSLFHLKSKSSVYFTLRLISICPGHIPNAREPPTTQWPYLLDRKVPEARVTGSRQGPLSQELQSCWGGTRQEHNRS